LSLVFFFEEGVSYYRCGRLSSSSPSLVFSFGRGFILPSWPLILFAREVPAGVSALNCVAAENLHPVALPLTSPAAGPTKTNALTWLFNPALENHPTFQGFRPRTAQRGSKPEHPVEIDSAEEEDEDEDGPQQP
jgi:hypothetical protein